MNSLPLFWCVVFDCKHTHPNVNMPFLTPFAINMSYH
jgi:hypothetical protein